MLVRKLTEDWDMEFGQGTQNYISDEEAVEQNVRTRLLTFKGEWFLDTSLGVPYINNDDAEVIGFLGVVPASIPGAEAIIKKAILEVKGVDRILSFASTFDHTTRLLTINTIIATIYATTIEVNV